MRKTSASAALLFPHLRQRVLAALLLHPKKEWYLTELVRHLSAAQAHLHRELALLVAAGVVRRRVEGRQVYYSPDPDCSYLPELTSLVRKIFGVPVMVGRALKPLRKKIAIAFIYGSVARGEETAASDIDLMVIGDATISDLLPRLEKAERELGRSINPTVYPKKELVEKYRQGNHFLRAVISDRKKSFLIGSQDELEEAVKGMEARRAQAKPGRNRRAVSARRSKTQGR